MKTLPAISTSNVVAKISWCLRVSKPAVCLRIFNLLDLRLSVGLAAAVLVLMTSGCVTRLETIGEWSRPSDLSLKKDFLANYKVQVQCGMIDKLGRVLARRYPVCRDLQDLIYDAGGKIVGSTDPAVQAKDVDFHFYYLDTGKTESSQSGVALAGFIFTGGIVPLVFTGASEAEFRVVDSRGVVLDQAPMKIAQVRAFGWGAIGGLFGESITEQKKEVSQTVYHYAKNVLASEVLRLEVSRHQEAHASFRETGAQ